MFILNRPKVANLCRKCNAEISGPANKRYCDACRKLVSSDAHKKKRKLLKG